jgi:hypothetical protein
MTWTRRHVAAREWSFRRRTTSSFFFLPLLLLSFRHSQKLLKLLGLSATEAFVLRGEKDYAEESAEKPPVRSDPSFLRSVYEARHSACGNAAVLTVSCYVGKDALDSACVCADAMSQGKKRDGRQGKSEVAIAKKLYQEVSQKRPDAFAWNANK